MATGHELREVVAQLNSEPFNLNLSLVTLDEKQPFEQIEVLNTVLIFLDKKHEVDLREEAPDAMYQRIGEFLHILGYKCSYDIAFQQGVVTGDKRVIHPILHWLLRNIDALKKRSYLANYCVTLEVPEDILLDEQVYELHQHYKEQQAQFKAVHSHLEQLRQSSVSPAELKREIVQLDAERDHLVQKIQSFKNKTANMAGFSVLLQATSQLRKEQEEEARIRDKIVEQKQQLDQTQALYLDSTRALHQVKDAQKTRDHGSAESMLKLLREEVTKNRTTYSRIIREVQEKGTKVAQFEQTLSEPSITQAQISQQDMEIEQRKNEIHHLQQVVEKQNDSDGKLTIYRQQASLVSKKKEIALREKRALEEERDRLHQELILKEREYEQFKGHKFLNRDEFKRYANNLRDKTAKFKAHKAELADIRQEVAVLSRTEQILTSRARSYDIQVEKLEREKGITGYVDTENELVEVSDKKRDIDMEKGQTLNEISKIVEEINGQIRLKKDKLAPQIKVLRKVRQEYQTVEQDFLQKKGIYDTQKLHYDGEINRITQDLEGLVKEQAQLERTFFELSTLITAADQNRKRAQKEKLCQQGTVTFHPEFPDFKSLSQYYEAEMRKRNDEQQELRKEKKKVEVSHPEALRQRQMFEQLQALMECKLRVVQQEALCMDKSAQEFRAALDHSVAGVNRLIVES
jgi:intraflagellar transport protein 81